MTLTGPQAKQIQDVLLAAFDTAELAQMVQFQLGEILEQIAGGTDLTEIVFNLVQWADRNGRVLDLIDGALAANPDNPQLQELQIEASGWHLAPPEEGEPPYQGLQYFDVDDADRFFGRENLTAELVGYLRDHRFLAVIGASGSGKSSVVRAGVVPALAGGAALADGTLPPKGSADWLVHILTPTAHPLKALSASLTKGSESVTAQATLMDDMTKDARSLDLFVSRMLADSPADHLLLVVDQFEELFTLCKDADERRHFVDNLLTAAQPDGVDDGHHHAARRLLPPLRRVRRTAHGAGQRPDLQRRQFLDRGHVARTNCAPPSRNRPSWAIGTSSRAWST